MQLKKVSKIYKKLKTKIRKRQEKKLISLLKKLKNSKKYMINNGTFLDLLKLLKYIIIQIAGGKNINMRLKKKMEVFIIVLKMRLLKNLRRRCS